jgi:hypothetical protein
LNKSAHSAPLSRWLIIGLFLALAFNLVVRWHLRNMPLERDEGEYAYAGQLILQGILPYKLAFNMKFPGVYFMYALIMAIFGQSAAGIHIGIFVVTSLTALLIFFIGRELLSDSGALVATVIYICLAALPRAAGLAGHATHFVSLFVCAGVSAMLMARRRNSLAWWFLSGIAFGLAILMKQHAAFFPLFILAWLLWRMVGTARCAVSAASSGATSVVGRPTAQFRPLCAGADGGGSATCAARRPYLILFCAGCILPFLVTAIGFACAGLWHSFIFWTFQYAEQYVSMLPLRAAPGQFAAGFDPVFESGIWVWIFGVVGLVCLWRQSEVTSCHSNVGEGKPSPHPEPGGEYLRPEDSPSPLPSPAGRGRIIARLFDTAKGEGGSGVQGEQLERTDNSQDYRQSPASAADNQRRPRCKPLVGLIFLAALAATVPGFYFRNHYFLMAMPGLALLNAVFILTIVKALKDHAYVKWAKYLPLLLMAFIVGDLLVNNAKMWFDRTSVQLSKELYSANPFPEAVDIAGYLKDHTSPDDTIAVLGSEPEIFFLSHRHSASGVIYFYSLTEPQPLAPRMGREFFSQTEAARPKYVVSVNMPLSWYSLISPESIRYASALQKWWDGYSTNYDIVGTVKISPNGQYQINWQESSLNASYATNDDLLIYRRR